MIEIRDCDDFEAAKELILEYSKIKGAESCFVSLDKELADLEGFYCDGALLLGYDEKNLLLQLQSRGQEIIQQRPSVYSLNRNAEDVGLQDLC